MPRMRASLIPAALLLSLTESTNACTGFLLPTTTAARNGDVYRYYPRAAPPPPRRGDDAPRRRRPSAADAADGDADADAAGSEGAGDDGGTTRRRVHHRWKHVPFDYSSRLGWDEFYENNNNGPAGIRRDGDDDGHHQSATTTTTTTTTTFGAEVLLPEEYEWHSHIPHSAIIEAVRPSISEASLRYYSLSPPRPGGGRGTATAAATPSILLVGCGNSALPRALHDAFDDVGVRVTCLDYSPVCIDMMKIAYGSAYPNVDFVVGDATDLASVTWNGGDDGDDAASSGDDDGDGDDRSSGESGTGTTRGRRRMMRRHRNFDVVIDKGLLDALMCGEGQDVERLVGGVNDVLVPHAWGLHVLICFPLSASVRRSLEGSSPGLAWEFDVPVEGSEDGRATFNLARRCRGQGADVLSINRISTEWVQGRYP